MRRRKLVWRHVIINTLGSWLHGDERGFRSCHHRIHSSGDYRNPPPRGEHANLLKYMKDHSRREIHIPPELRPIIGRAIIVKLREMKHRVIAVAVTKIHGHAVTELPDDVAEIKEIVGQAKRVSSRGGEGGVARKSLDRGGCTYERIESVEHLHRAYEYVLYKQGRGAWTWSHADEDMTGQFNRKRPNAQKKNPGRR